jgi:hypothetical protein
MIVSSIGMAYYILRDVGIEIVRGIEKIMPRQPYTTMHTLGKHIEHARIRMVKRNESLIDQLKFLFYLDEDNKICQSNFDLDRATWSQGTLRRYGLEAATNAFLTAIIYKSSSDSNGTTLNLVDHDKTGQLRVIWRRARGDV